jgi:hypothetical protein
MWVLFWDMHSGGGQKEKWAKLYIEAESEDEAKVIFYNRFGHNPERVTCTCCGGDYSISSAETLEQASGYHRGCNWASDKSKKGGGSYEEKPGKHEKYQTIAEYKKGKDVKVILAMDVKPEERTGDVPEQGYVWVE